MVNFRQLLIRLLIAATFVATGVFAQTNLSQILDTITNPDGTPFNGTVVITWNGYSGSGSGTVSRLSTSARVYNGALSVLLVPTTTASPGTYYQVVYNSSNGTVSWTETWQVPPSTTALTIAQVRQSSTLGTSSGGGSTGGSSSTQYATLPIQISQITGLASDLSTINTTLTTLQTNATALSTTVSGQGTSLTNLTSTVTGQGNTLSTLGNTVNGLSNSIASINSTLGGLNNTVTGLNTTVTGLGTTVTGLSSSVTAINSTLGGLNNTVSGLNTTVTGLGTSVSTLNSTVSGQGSSISTLNSNLNGLTTTVANNTSSLNTVSSTVGGLSTNVTNLTNLVNGLSTTVSSLTAATSNAVFVDAELPAGTINGVNTAFSLANTPAPPASLTLYRNGVEMGYGTDYTLNGSAITFASTSLPRTGDSLVAYYRTTGATVAAANFADDETPVGTINGTNLVFTLATAPNPATSLRLYRNGIIMAQGGDYTLNGSSITFITASTPRTGDSLAAYYRH